MPDRDQLQGQDETPDMNTPVVIDENRNITMRVAVFIALGAVLVGVTLWWGSSRDASVSTQSSIIAINAWRSSKDREWSQVRQDLAVIRREVELLNQLIREDRQERRLNGRE